MVFHWRVALCTTHLQAGSMLGFGEPCSFGEEQQLRREEKFKLLSFVTEGRKEGNVLFNDALNTFYLRLYGIRYMVKDHSDSEREETRCCHIGYSFQLTAKVLLYAQSHKTG